MGYDMGTINRLILIIILYTITPTLTDDIRLAIYSEGMIAVYSGDYCENPHKYGFVRIDGTEITNYIFDYAYPFSKGLACVRINDKYGYIDFDGKTALPFVYDYATPFAEGLAYFERDGVYGFMDQNGEAVFFPDCDSVSSFQDGLAFFSIDGKYGYMDASGAIVIPPQFEDAGYFTDGLAMVRAGGAYGLIDNTGAFVVQPVYDDFSDIPLPARNDAFYYQYDSVIGINNGIVTDKYSGSGQCEITITGEPQPENLSFLLLRNEITPRMKQYNLFVREGIFNLNSAWFDEASGEIDFNRLNSFICRYRLYGIDAGIPAMIFHAQPIVIRGFAHSFSGYYTLNEGRLNTLATGYESGGSIGGDCVYLTKDKQTGEILYGSYYHHSGFGGNAYGADIYRINDGIAEQVLSYGCVHQQYRNYDVDELIENAHLFYDENDEPFTPDTIIQSDEDNPYISEYSVNNERASIKSYLEVIGRFTILRPL